MNKFILTLALAVFAVTPTFAQDAVTTDDDTMLNEQPFSDNVESGTSNEELDTTLTDEPGVLEEQVNDHSANSESYYFPSSDSQDIQSGATAEGADAPMTESRALAPRGIDGRGSWNITVGPALTIGLESDNVLYGVSGGYTFNLTPKLGARIFADANFGTGDESSQYLDAGVAAKLGVGDVIGQQTSRAYLLGDVALANAENADTNDTESGVAVGAGIGYTVMRTQRTDIDVLLRYSLMLTEVEGDLPSLLTARVGVNF